MREISLMMTPRSTGDPQEKDGDEQELIAETAGNHAGTRHRGIVRLLLEKSNALMGSFQG